MFYIFVPLLPFKDNGLPLWGRDCPLPALAALAYLSPAGDGLLHSQLALLSPPFCEQAWQYFSLGLFAG